MVGTQPCRCRIVVRIVRMETGSRILTTVAMSIWLTNVMLWLFPWLFGGGFAIGDLASFTLWLGQSKSFRNSGIQILPEPVSSELWRTVAFERAPPPSLRSWACWLYSYRKIRLQTVECTEYVHPRPGTGFADLLRRGISPGAMHNLTGIRAVRSSNDALGASSSCSHRRRRHGLHLRVVGHSTALGLTTERLLAR